MVSIKFAVAAGAAAGAAVALVVAKLLKAKKGPSADGCVIYYHTACKKFTGRATPILYILEHAGVPYTVEDKDAVVS